MPQLREEIDADITSEKPRVTEFKTAQTGHELLCGSCGTIFYVDDVTHENFKRALAFDSAHEFCCDTCSEDLLSTDYVR
jgi:hypothetical protein